MSALTVVQEQKCFGGRQIRYQHASAVLNCEMQFSVFLPPQAATQNVPALYWLSGLTCSDENFSTKAGAQRVAAELGIALIIPDTSPRGEGVPDDAAYDLGVGAGFYVNATQSPWSDHYRMYDYVLHELPALIEATFPVSSLRSIAGHSMGGHGALVLALRNPDRFKAVSAFSPISNPVNSPWGKKALAAYLGKNTDSWADYDASLLMRRASQFVPARVDQGESDEFMLEQLKPDTLAAAAKVSGYPLALNRHEGYDHSYFFIASFMGDHIAHHAAALAG